MLVPKLLPFKVETVGIMLAVLHTLGGGEMYHVAVFFEHVDLLNCLDRLYVHFL